MAIQTFLGWLIAALVAVGLGYCFLQYLPQRTAFTRGKVGDRLRFENEVRRTWAQILGGMLLLGGLFLSWRTLDNAQKTTELAREAQLTDRFIRAVELLGVDARDTRVGAVHALGRIAVDSAADRRAVSDLLVAFIRSRAPRDPMHTEEKPDSRIVELFKGRAFHRAPEDIQAALSVLMRAGLGGLVDLRETDLVGADMSGAILDGLILHKSDLRDANLIGADMRNAVFGDSLLWRANFQGGNFDGAVFAGADLAAADLTDGSFRSCWFYSANLGAADLTGADFSGAELVAQLPNGALTLAALVTQAQLDTACGDAATLLPEGLTIPACS